MGKNMKIKPILFSTPMIRALLDGRKTQTRRVVKVQPNTRHYQIEFEGGFLKEYSRVAGCWYLERKQPCPYGKVGDLLWVRETFSDNDSLNKHLLLSGNPKVFYAADLHHSVTKVPTKYRLGRWKPSIFMPRWASRLTLKINNVRVERLQDISESDAYEEGIDTEGAAYNTAEHYQSGGSSIQGRSPAVFAFIDLWQSINGKGSWYLNPWVWVLEFEVIQQNVDEYLRGAA